MRKHLCIVLAFIICCTISIYSYADELEDLQSEHKQVQNDLNDANDELGGVQDELSANLQQVKKLDQTISERQKELDDVSTRINELNTLITDVSGKLQTIETRYNEQKTILEERLVAIYEAGDTKYIDVLLNSSSLSDFLSNYYLISEVASYDKELLDDVESQKNEVEQNKQVLENSKKELVTIKQNQLKTSKVLKNTKTVRQYYISKLSKEEKGIQSKIDKYEKRFEQIEKEIQKLSNNSISPMYIGGEMAWPVPGYTRISSRFGMRTHPITGVYKLHTGVDISAPMGTNFIAAADGIVTKAGYNSAYGNMVIIDHGGGISTLYAHGSEIVAKVRTKRQTWRCYIKSRFNRIFNRATCSL